MKHNLIILFSIIITLNLHAQEKKSYQQLGLLICFDNNLSSHDVKLDKYSGYLADYNKTNYKIGIISEERYIYKKLSIIFTLGYSNKDFTGTYYNHLADFITPPQPEEIKLQLIEATSNFRYYFVFNKFKIFATVGISDHLSISKKNLTSKYVSETSDIIFMLSGRTGGGFKYNLNEEFSVQLITEYNKGLTNMLKESNYKINYFSLGFGVVKKI